MAKYIYDTCPVCMCGEYSIIGNVKEESPPVKIPQGSAIVKCGNCRLIFVNPMPYWDSADYENLYDATYFSHLESEGQRKWLNIRKNIIPEKRFQKINQQLKSPLKKVLEIGAGEYAFMCRYLISKGWDATAQEPGRLFAEKLREIDGLKVETTDILNLTGKGCYSVIFADSVLEHVPNPIEYYNRFADLLAPGGILYTVSPNEYSMHNYLANIFAKRKGSTPRYIAPYVQPYHLVGYTKKSLEILAETTELTLLRYDKTDDYMSFHAMNSSRNPLIK